MTHHNYIDRVSAINRPEPLRPVAIPDSKPMGQSTPAILVACFFAVFLFPLGIMCGFLSAVVLYPDSGLDAGGKVVGWALFGFVNSILVGIVVVFLVNRLRNYAFDILGMSFIAGCMLAHALFGAAYRIGGPEAFL